MESRESIDSSDMSSLDDININNEKIITVGKCSRFYLFFLGSALFKLFSLVLLGNSTKSFGLFGFCPTFNSFNFIQSIFIYFGYIIFGTIFLFFKDIKKVQINELVRKRATIKRNYIYNKSPDGSIKNIRTKIILLGLAFVLYIEIKKVLYIEGFQFFNFWTIEIIFMLHFMKKYFIMDFYKHHKVSIVFIISMCSILLLTASFLPTSLLGENSGNSYYNIKEKLGSYYYSILFIFIFAVLSYDYSFSRTYCKILMQIKFISPYKIIIIFGIVGFIISLIASIVSYYIKYYDNMISYFSNMREVLHGDKTYKFWVEIFCVYPLYSFSNYMEITFEILTIYYLNPFYVLMTNNLYYGITELITFLLNLSDDKLKIIHFLIAEFSEIFAFLGYMVYLEILELHFCGLDESIKRLLMKKGENEFRKLSNTNFNDNDNNKYDEDEDKEKENSDYIGPYRNI